MTGSGKTGLIATITDIHFLPVRECCTHALHRWPGLLLQTAFYRCCQTTRVHFMALEGINRTAWGTRLLLTAVLASLVDSTSLCPILRAQHCCLSPNGCFNPPSASHPPPHPPPAHPPPIDSIRDITSTEKNHPKTSSIQVACRNSYERIAI